MVVAVEAHQNYLMLNPQAAYSAVVHKQRHQRLKVACLEAVHKPLQRNQLEASSAAEHHLLPSPPLPSPPSVPPRSQSASTAHKT